MSKSPSRSLLTQDHFLLVLLLITIMEWGILNGRSLVAQADQGPLSQRPLSRFAFGSCNKQHLPQPLWTPIAEAQPQLWIWAGDAVYGDTLDPVAFAKIYQQQMQNPAYQNFLKSGIPILGVWDDHDFGVNDGGADYPGREFSQQLFLDFLGEPKDGPRRQQKGLYQSTTYGPEGRQVKVLLLDIRYHKENPGPNSDILGAEQWAWLERELESSKAQLHFIISGIQVIPHKHRFEKWANFPKGRQRLLRLLKDKRVPGVVFLSGDRHFAEISRLAPGDQDPSQAKSRKSEALYPIYEVTSSGLTHTYTPLMYEENPNRVGRIFKDLNFGFVEIDWEKNPVTVKLQVRGRENRPALEQVLTLPEISPSPLQGQGR